MRAAVAALPTPAPPLAAPLSSDPRLIGRTLDHLARGVRSLRSLQESLGADAKDVEKALAAAAWLGLVDLDGEPLLTEAGLTWVYAGPAPQRARVWARLVLNHPFVAPLLQGPPPALPAVPIIGDAVRAALPGLDDVAVRQRAAAIRALVLPALGKQRPSEATQMTLPLAAAVPTDDAPLVSVGPGREYDPDLFRYVLCGLLDHGELALGEIRALLDRANVSEAPIGGYVDMLVARGDAVRVGERIVASRQACQRRELCDTTTSVVLSDPGWRGYLADWRAAATGDRNAEIRRDKNRARYRLWDRRLFGRDLQADEVEAALRRVLMDRGLTSFPLAAGPGTATKGVPQSFLDAWTSPDLAVALPPSLESLRRGLSPVNHALKHARQGVDDVHLPDLAHRPAIVHGGLVHPGEAPPRTVPDVRTLRVRLLSNAPYPAMATALLLLHRREPARALKWRRGGYGLRVGEETVDLLDVIDAFAVSRGWIVSRRRRGLGSGALVSVLETVGVATPSGDLAVLAERFFAQLRTDPEERPLHDRLGALSDAMGTWLDA